MCRRGISHRPPPERAPAGRRQPGECRCSPAFRSPGSSGCRRAYRLLLGQASHSETRARDHLELSPIVARAAVRLAKSRTSIILSDLSGRLPSASIAEAGYVKSLACCSLSRTRQRPESNHHWTRGRPRERGGMAGCYTELQPSFPHSRTCLCARVWAGGMNHGFPERTRLRSRVAARSAARDLIDELVIQEFADGRQVCICRECAAGAQGTTPWTTAGPLPARTHTRELSQKLAEAARRRQAK